MENTAERLSQAELLEIWSDRTTLYTYASVLSALLRRGVPDEELLTECTRVIRGAGPLVEYTHYVHLSFGLLQHLVSDAAASRTREIALFFDRNLAYMSELLAAEQNRDGLRLLRRVFPERSSEFLRRQAVWDVQILYRDGLRYLVDLASRGLYVALFLYYVRVLEPWGLPLTKLDPRLELDLSTEEGRTRILDLLEGGDEIDYTPIVGVQGRRQVNVAFVAAATCLSSPASAVESRYDADRERFNGLAERFFVELTAMLVTLPSLPAEMTAVLRDHARRLSEFTPD
jgi:hypothetical protein